MAKLVYDEKGRLLFTKEMKEEYTILIPMMAPIHFGIIKTCLLYTSVLMLPKGELSPPVKGSGLGELLNPSLLFYVGQSIVFAIFFYILQTNLALLVAERGLGEMCIRDRSTPAGFRSAGVLLRPAGNHSGVLQKQIPDPGTHPGFPVQPVQGGG